MRFPRLLLPVAARKIALAACISCLLLVSLLFVARNPIKNAWHIVFQNQQAITQLYFDDVKSLPARLAPSETSEARFTVVSNSDIDTPYLITVQHGRTSTVLASGTFTLHANQPITQTIPITMPNDGSALITVTLPQLQHVIHFNIKETS